MDDDAASRRPTSPARRLSQLFSEYGGAGSTPGSPRPLPRRSPRAYNPPPPPYSQSTVALGLAFDRLHHMPVSQSFDRLQSSFPPHYGDRGSPPPLHRAAAGGGRTSGGGGDPPLRHCDQHTLSVLLDRLTQDCGTSGGGGGSGQQLSVADNEWQDKCGEMQLELQRFKCQAAKVRDMLRDKLSELEGRVEDAEGRAELAEIRLRCVMDERSDSEPTTDAVVITQLETQVEEQRQLRLEDAKQVEAKAARIKEWVTNKLRELEEQNQRLREQNQKCNAQLELLRDHLAHSSLSLASSNPLPLSTAVSVGSLDSGEPVYAEVERRRPASHQSLSGVATLEADAVPATATTSLPRCEETTHDYAEIYTPSREKIPWITPEPSVAAKPPTPPLHRFPSWESRIYQVAAAGLQLPNGPTLVDNSTSPPTTGYCDISVPVYATVKGRASQIRSVPFTGDSSDDSSEGEDHHALHLSTNSSSDTSCDNKMLTNRSSDNTSSGSLSPSKCSLSPAKQAAARNVRRDTSFESGMSDDYAIPPDALSCDTTASVGSSLLCRMSTLTVGDTIRGRPLDGPGNDLEKCGHLAKLGGKLKTWRKRYFVLRNGALSFWKTASDVHRKPQGVIVLDEACRISRADGAATFEINTAKKVYYLTADGMSAMEDWIRVLQNVQRRNATKLLLSKDDNKPTISGWLTKVKNGHAKKCWCVLIGKMFLYFKTPSDNNPIGQINMRDTRAEEVDMVSDSDSEDRGADVTELTIGLFPSHQSPTYLILPTKQDKDQWLYQLTVVSGCGPSTQGTPFEQLVHKLMETDGDPSCVLWRHPQLQPVKESIVSPLTTLSSEALQTEAIKLFKSCQLFMSVQLHSAGIDYHVVLAQNALAQCLAQPELQSELVCGLVKQTMRPVPHNTRSTGVQSGSPTSLQGCATVTPPTPPDSFVAVQGWQLLALAVSLFVPRNNRVLWLLKLHLSRNTDPKSECGKYAAYCSRALERTLVNGGRETKPSRMEVLSILLKNPYHHSLPHAIPVHMLNGAYQVVGFDGSTTIEEFLSTLNQEIGCRDAASSGFTLFSDDPIEKDMEHYLDPAAKLCDVISKWETALREKGCGKFENSRVIQLTFKNRLYWRHGSKMETDRERLLLCYQVNQLVVLGRFPLSRELAQELAALMAQIDFGECNAEKARGSGSANPGHQALQALDKFYPYRYKDGITQEDLKELEIRLQERWALLKGRGVLDCVRIYLTCARKWPLFGAALFQAARKAPAPPVVVWLAVAEDGVTLLELGGMAPVTRVDYANVVTFGGCQEDFMLVAHEEGVSRKMIFVLAKPKILEVTLLIADYMNALGHPVPPGTPQMGSLTRHRTLPRPDPSGKPAGLTQPDILKSTPDHQLVRSDSKKRNLMDATLPSSQA